MARRAGFGGSGGLIPARMKARRTEGRDIGAELAARASYDKRGEQDMKRPSSLATSLAALRKAEAQLQELRTRAAAERARLLEDLHVRLGYVSRDDLIEALVAIDGEDVPRRPPVTRKPTPSDAPRMDPPSRNSRDKKPRSLRADAAEVIRAPRERSNRSAAAVQNVQTAPNVQTARDVHNAPLPFRSIKRVSMGPTPGASDADSSKAAADVAREPVVDLPGAVRRLLDSTVAREPRWAVPEERHTIVVEILTRGDDAAERWLWSQTSREDARSLLRRYGGAGFDDEARDILRRKMGLTERDVPRRPFRAPIARHRLVPS